MDHIGIRSGRFSHDAYSPLRLPTLTVNLIAPIHDSQVRAARPDPYRPRISLASGLDDDIDPRKIQQALECGDEYFLPHPHPPIKRLTEPPAFMGSIPLSLGIESPSWLNCIGILKSLSPRQSPDLVKDKGRTATLPGPRDEYVLTLGTHEIGCPRAGRKFPIPGWRGAPERFAGRRRGHVPGPWEAERWPQLWRGPHPRSVRRWWQDSRSWAWDSRDCCPPRS